MSGRTGRALGWHSEGRAFDPPWLQQVLKFVSRIAPFNTWSSGGTSLCRLGGATSHLDLPSLTPLSVACCGLLQLGVAHWATSVDLQVFDNWPHILWYRFSIGSLMAIEDFTFTGRPASGYVLLLYRKTSWCIRALTLQEDQLVHTCSYSTGRWAGAYVLLLYTKTSWCIRAHALQEDQLCIRAHTLQEDHLVHTCSYSTGRPAGA